MAGSFGYGQQDPNDSAGSFNLWSFVARQMIARISTMKLVKVVAVHVDSPDGVGPAGTVDVLPLVSQIDGQGNAVPHGVVYGIPFLRLGAGGCAVVIDPKVDDLGMVVVADRDISSVKKTRDVSTPGSRRTYDLADGVYVGEVLAQVPTCYVAFTRIGGERAVVFSPDGGVTSITIQPGKITLSADEIVTHAKVKNVWDANGTGFVYETNAINTYTDGVPSSHHLPNPPEVPT